MQAPSMCGEQQGPQRGRGLRWGCESCRREPEGNGSWTGRVLFIERRAYSEGTDWHKGCVEGE